jgi:hypothetical protein
MGQYLHAVIGPKHVVGAFANNWVPARAVSLAKGFAVVPLTAALFDDIVGQAKAQKPDPYQGFERLASEVVSAIEDASQKGPLVYLETDYLGGLGRQAAIAWIKGKVAAGPCQSETVSTPEGQSDKPEERAINRVFTKLGIWRHPGLDPFEALGLHRYRDTERVS